MRKPPFRLIAFLLFVMALAVVAQALTEQQRRPTAKMSAATETRAPFAKDSVRFLVVGPTHTRGDTAFFVVGDGVLFTGDVVMNNSFLAATAVSSMKAWLAAFDALAAWHPRTVVPSHGAVGAGTLIATNRAVMQSVQTRARELKAGGWSADDVAMTVQSELQAKYPDWPRANGLVSAARSAYAEAP